ncbi:type II toxin-antitoxin system RelE/ParE family toxin [Sphingobium soli]|uniref:Type II toxin-antitoxin system RelE/ParE family toxin n=1 Tax=Sphingobium soli TaxID=1591116 RepID=A0ABS8H418_9SPHN|nr:type II toxin-antitoxin system RelE/ParE family toxin [Sphingobium soli]
MVGEAGSRQGCRAASVPRLIDFGNSSYVALYRVDGETVAILAVRHQKKAGYGQTS